MNAVALITGGSRGIGRGIAMELAKLGYDLVLGFAENVSLARQTETDCLALALSRGLTIHVEFCRADIAHTAGRQKLIDYTRTHFKRLDLLVNNAGVAPKSQADILDASEESFDHLMQVNVKAPYFLTQLAARWMIEQRTAGLPSVPFAPKIVTITSINAYAASVSQGDYCVAKAALSMLTPLFATRLAEHGIRVYEIRPGIITTNGTSLLKEKYDLLIRGGLTPLSRWGTPEDVGKAVAALAQDLLPFSTGDILNVDGGFHLRRL
jgi:NAD(P)-dependent dehydrogenase (short-subunit alcohol dehydrogenase family)